MLSYPSHKGPFSDIRAHARTHTTVNSYTKKEKEEAIDKRTQERQIGQRRTNMQSREEKKQAKPRRVFSLSLSLSLSLRNSLKLSWLDFTAGSSATAIKLPPSLFPVNWTSGKRSAGFVGRGEKQKRFTESSCVTCTEGQLEFYASTCH